MEGSIVVSLRVLCYYRTVHSEAMVVFALVGPSCSQSADDSDQLCPNRGTDLCVARIVI